MEPPKSNGAKVRSYRDLVVWQKAMALAIAVYRATGHFPKDELYGLTSQMRRAAVSVASNIAEGQARHSRREFLLFLSHARGSLAELETQSVLAARLEFLSPESEQSLADRIAEVGRLLSGLRRSLKSTDKH
jgi:four helix bundle protein